MDLILYNGRIFTMRHESEIYSAVAIKDGIVAALGQDEILDLKANTTQIIDLKGKDVFPGFNDSHMHLLGLGASLSQVDLSNANSKEDVINITKDFIKKHNIKKNHWVVGRGWNQDNFNVKEIITADDLDQVSSEHYLFLRRACGHVATCNTHLLNTFGFKKDKTIIDGGAYENGVFKENALELVTEKMQLPTKEDLMMWIKAGAEYVNSLGITSVQSDDFCVFSETLIPDIITCFNELDQKKELSVRVYEQSLLRNKDILQQELDSGYLQNKGSDFFKLGPLKILGDGSLGGRTAWLNKPYVDSPDETGIHMYEQDELNEYVALAHENNIASAIHCIGDRMLDSALEAITNAKKKSPNTNLRHGIVHCQITSNEQLKRMRDLDIMAYVQPIFLDYDAHIVYDRVGELAETSYNWKTMMDFGLKMSFGSDAPVDSADPLKGIHCAVTRQGLDKTPVDGYLKNQSISVYDAIYNYTVESAYASYDEDKKGMLLPGFLADMVILNGDIFDDILKTEVFMTIVGGVIRFKKV